MFPVALQKLWDELDGVRKEFEREASGLTQAQADWRPSEQGWSCGEIIHHITLGEVNTGKLVSKLTKEAAVSGALRPFPVDVREFEPLPPFPLGLGEAPLVVRPTLGRPIGDLLGEMRMARERTWQTMEKLATMDPRPLTWEHQMLGALNLAQWVRLHARHEGIHLAQIREVKSHPGFPRG